MLFHMTGRAQTSPTASAADSGFGLAGFPQPNLDGGPGTGERPDRTQIRDGWAGLIAMLQRMERTYTQFEAQGRASMLGRLALVDSLGQLPGRKTLFYFCEGLTISDSQLARFRAVIDTANRNNVSVYTSDAAGLRVHSAQQQTAREIRELTFTGLGLAATRSEKWNEGLEENERLLKMDPAVSLGILADQTGGLLVNNTNALDRAIDRINDDRRNHYLLSYVSTNATLDGAYRKIEVKVKRRDVEVRARRGYRALAAGTSAPVLGYEAPALAALTQKATPMAFPILARALSTPMPRRPGLTAVIVGFNGSSLQAGRDKEEKTYLADGIVLARVVGGGKELARSSQQYQFTGEVDRQQASMSRDVLFFRTPELPSGRHIVEAVVHDGIAGRSTVVRIPVDIPEASSRIVVGDLMVVVKAEPFAAGPDNGAWHPLVWKGVLLYPSFGEPVSLAAQRELAFALPMTASGLLPSATLELVRRGEVLTKLPLPVDAPLADGRLVVVGRLPLAQIPAGAYDLRVSVDAGGHTVLRTAAVTLTR